MNIQNHFEWKLSEDLKSNSADFLNCLTGTHLLINKTKKIDLKAGRREGGVGV